jgi:16S rRNA (uracil1498-N3)-methyltransferase
MMHRFFVSPSDIQNNQVVLQNGQADQLIRVLRVNVNDRIVALDNTGWEYDVIIRRFSKNDVIGEITGKTFKKNEKGVKTNLFISPLKKDNFEWVIQKSTELGIDNLVPVISKRTVVSFDNWGMKYLRWDKIIQEASEQSGRPIKAIINPPMSFDKAILTLPKTNINLIAWEKEQKYHIQKTSDDLQKNHHFGEVCIFVGPEGGFTDNEIDFAIDHGLKTVSLGTRILRSETAAIAACSILISILDTI